MTSTGKISPSSISPFYFNFDFIISNLYTFFQNFQYMFKDTLNIIANLSGPQKKQGHNLYTLIGSDKNGQFNTVKRFFQFHTLRKTLKQRWPGCYIPSLPEKKLFGNDDSILLQIRKIGLDYFIENLKNSETLWYSQEVQLFIRKEGDCEKELQKLSVVKVPEILQRYKKEFIFLENKKPQANYNEKIIQFGSYLKKAKALIEKLEKTAEQIFSARNKYNEKFLNLVQNMLPQYQAKCLEVFKTENNLEELIFTGPKAQKLKIFYDEFKKKKNNIIHVLGEIRKEKEQIISFEEIIKIRQHYIKQKQKAHAKLKDFEIETTKIYAGKQSLMSKIKNKSKEDQLKQNESYISKTREEEENLQFLCEIIALLLVKSEINNFKGARQKSYYCLLRTLFELQRQQCKLKKNFWSIILKENFQQQELDNFFEKQKSPLKMKQKKSLDPTDALIQTENSTQIQQIQTSHNNKASRRNSIQGKKKQQVKVESLGHRKVEELNQSNIFAISQ